MKILRRLKKKSLLWKCRLTSHKVTLLFGYGDDPAYYNYCEVCGHPIRVIYDHRLGTKTYQEILDFPAKLPIKRRVKNGRVK